METNIKDNFDRFVMRKIVFVLIMLVACHLVNAQYTDGCENPSGKKCIYVAPGGSGSGSLSSPYGSIQTAVNAMNPGDHIVLRGGTHAGCICISPSKNGDSWSSGQYNKMYSYPGEWAIIDGQDSCHTPCAGGGEPGGILLGYAVWATGNTAYDLKYWWFERLELTGGSGRSDIPGIHSAGFWGNGGPFKFRYLYIHDNQADNGGENPGGLKGQCWQDSLVEYCYFKNNGMRAGGGDNNNPANLVIYSDYNPEYIARNGFNVNDNQGHAYRNEIRYNYFEGSYASFKNKNAQFLTARPSMSSLDWQDSEYDTYGDKIHHNIFYGASVYAIGPNTDFDQIYNNIIDSNDRGIASPHEPNFGELYKIVIYNNLIRNSNSWDIRRFTDTAPPTHYGWDYNNMIENPSGCNWIECDNECSIAVGACGGGSLSEYYNTNNFFYNPSSSLFNLERTTYSASGFETQTKTAGPKIVYTTSSGSPYVGSSGADKYITRGDYSLGSGATIADGGVGGAHPYLNGVTIPSYVGAVNPDDNAWVAGVMGLRDVAVLQSMDLDDPTWIEGSGATGPVCGNGNCEAGETNTNCPDDCPSGPVCGDGTCDAGETNANCPDDCPSGPVCGDGTCDAGETNTNCPADCQIDCVHEADLPVCDGCIDTTELSAYIDKWKAGTAEINNLMTVISLWKQGC